MKQCYCKGNGKEREDTLNDGVVEGSIIKERQDKSKNQKKDKRYRLD